MPLRPEIGQYSTFVRPAYQLGSHNDQTDHQINSIKCPSATIFKQKDLPLHLTKGLDSTFGETNLPIGSSKWSYRSANVIRSITLKSIISKLTDKKTEIWWKNQNMVKTSNFYNIPNQWNSSNPHEKNNMTKNWNKMA